MSTDGPSALHGIRAADAPGYLPDTLACHIRNTQGGSQGTAGQAVHATKHGRPSVAVGHFGQPAGCPAPSLIHAAILVHCLLQCPLQHTRICLAAWDTAHAWAKTASAADDARRTADNGRARGTHAGRPRGIHASTATALRLWRTLLRGSPAHAGLAAVLRPAPVMEEALCHPLF